MVSYVYPRELHRFEVRQVMSSRPALQLQSMIELKALEVLDSVAAGVGKQFTANKLILTSARKCATGEKRGKTIYC